MKNLYSILLILVLSQNSCGQSHPNDNTPMESSHHNYTNHLIHETSPYLLQHAHNPVDWYPWGEEALNKAKKENKPIIISVGYAACHWCHVMEHESFEDEEVAKYMNEHFISIKVDREERPDIDQVYMNAIQLLTGSGGWPLNCIALPDGRPVYGGTYFPKNSWLDMLSKLADIIKNEPEKAEKQAEAVTQGVKTSELIHTQVEKTDITIKDLHTVFDAMKTTIDYKEGGQKGAPKFPMPVGFEFLLQYFYMTKDKNALLATTTTLDKMADGGIYDQIGGGFSRYSTDGYWKVPHFEKMLYDNAQLVSLYSNAYKLTKKTYYKTIVEETLEFVQRELTSNEGGFYSSLDADSEGEEGKFYVWTQKELEAILGEETTLMSDYYNTKNSGNWEQGNNILFKSDNQSTLLSKYNLTEKQLDKKIKGAKQLLLKERTKKIRPALDDKILTGWNGLMLKAYVEAYRTFDNPQYLTIALKNADFINSKLRSKDYRLDRNYKNGKSSINGFLDDYAFTIEAFIDLYQATFDEKWLNIARLLTEYTIQHFYDKNSGMFFYTSDIDPQLIARKMELNDNVIPASNSIMAKNLFKLGHYFYSDNYIDMSKTMIHNVKGNALKGGIYYANWSSAMIWLAQDPYQVAIVGKDWSMKRKEFDQYYLPNVFLSGGANEGSLEVHKDKLISGQTTLYVCQKKSCQRPTTDIKEAIKQLK